MLWYKAWLETRSRFLISLAGITFLCSLVVFNGDRLAPSYSVRHDYIVLYEGHATLSILWVVAVTLLMMGGLLREKASGASSFTLALPKSRLHLMAVRIVTGLIQAAALAIVPWCAMFLIGSIVGRTYSLSLPGSCLASLLGGGMLFFAIAVLISSLVEGEYTAPAISYGVVLAIGLILGDLKLNSLNPWIFILNPGSVNEQTGLFVRHISWLQMTAWLSLAGLILFLSLKAIQKKEF